MAAAIDEGQAETINRHRKENTQDQKNQPGHEKNIASRAIRQTLILATNDLAGDLAAKAKFEIRNPKSETKSNHPSRKFKTKKRHYGVLNI
jgi:hypothetical protein